MQTPLGSGSVLVLALLPHMSGCEGDQAGSPAQATPSAMKAPGAVADEAWWEAGLKGDVKHLSMRLEHGVGVDSLDEQGRTALSLACYNGHTAAAELLLKHKARIDHQDKQGRTPLIYAASGPSSTTVELLLLGGADPNLIDEAEGWSALMWAAAEGHKRNVELLLRHGARRKLLDKDGDSALAFAQRKGHREVAALLAE